MAGPGIRTDIQFLRAVAVGLVVADHAGFPFADGGFVGVDVFFVVSGFLITGLLVREVDRTGRISITDFYARRARRILPAATVVLVATTAWAAVRLPASRVHEIATDSGWAAAFLANIHFARLGTDYFSADRALSPVQHFWSLAVEEQFYLVWPLAMLGVVLVTRGRPAGRRLLVAVVALAWLVSLAWSAHLTGADPTTAYFSPFTRTFELATGAGLALTAYRLDRLGDRSRLLLALAGLSAVGWAAADFGPATPFPGTAALLPVLGTAAVLAAGTGGSAPSLGGLLGWRPAQWLGDRSYSLYLWHWPVLVLGRPELPFGGLPAGIVLVLVAVALSEASFRWVETPLRAPGFRPLHGRGGLLLWPAAAAMVLGSCAAAVSHADHALADRQEAARAYWADQAAQRGGPVEVALRVAVRAADDDAPVPSPLGNLEGLQDDIWQTDFRCFADWPDATARICPLGERSSKRTMVVFGDSHAGMWLPALDEIGKRAGIRVVPLVKVGCGPYDVVQRQDGKGPYPTCPEFREWAHERIAELRPELLVLGARTAWAVDPGPGETETEAWNSGVESALEELRPLAGRVAVLSGIARFDFSPRECLTAPETTMRACTVPYAGPAAGPAAELNGDGERIARRAGADFVDVSGLLCVDRRCPLAADMTAVYRDRDHITATWGRRVSRDLGVLLGLERTSDERNHPPAG